MRSGHKYRIVVFLTLLAIIAFPGCEEANMKTINKTLEEAKEINANSDFGGMEYLQLSNLTKEQISEYNYDQPEGEGTDDFYVEGLYYPYPDRNGEMRLTQIYISGGNYHIFDIKFGDNVDEVAEILEKRGYKETESHQMYEGTNTKKFNKYDIIIQLYTEPESYRICRICVYTNTHAK